MEARWKSLALVVTCCFLSTNTFGAASSRFKYRTDNFIVFAPSQSIAQEAALTAERAREEIALDWLGYKLPKWAKPCQIQVKVGQLGAGGDTSFKFGMDWKGNSQVYDWRMRVQGTLERILDSVIPHEVSHTIFACRFLRPLPRWADEGAATLAEHYSEQRRHQLALKSIWKTRQQIPLRKLLSIKQYPRDPQGIMSLYAQGYSLVDFLVQSKGKSTYLSFLDYALKSGWTKAIYRYYRFRDIEALESRWKSWVLAGSPRLKLPPGQKLAKASSTKEKQHLSGMLIRSQTPNSPKSLTQKPKLVKKSTPEEHALKKSKLQPPLKVAQTLLDHSDALAKNSSVNAFNRTFPKINPLEKQDSEFRRHRPKPLSFRTSSKDTLKPLALKQVSSKTTWENETFREHEKRFVPPQVLKNQPNFPQSWVNSFEGLDIQ